MGGIARRSAWRCGGRLSRRTCTLWGGYSGVSWPQKTRRNQICHSEKRSRQRGNSLRRFRGKNHRNTNLHACPKHITALVRLQWNRFLLPPRTRRLHIWSKIRVSRLPRRRTLIRTGNHRACCRRRNRLKAFGTAWHLCDRIYLRNRWHYSQHGTLWFRRSKK